MMIVPYKEHFVLCVSKFRWVIKSRPTILKFLLGSSNKVWSMTGSGGWVMVNVTRPWLDAKMPFCTLQLSILDN